MTDTSNLQLISHPLAQHKLTFMRDKDCSTSRFRQLTRELGAILAYEAVRTRNAAPVIVQTPLSRQHEAFYFEGAVMMAEKFVLLPILRAGLVLAEGGLESIPNAHVGHLGLYREADYKTLRPYLISVPMPDDYYMIIMDLAIGTGATASAAIDHVRRLGVALDRLCLTSVIATPQGLETLNRRHPAVRVISVAIDPQLDEAHHIVPGLGDTADRLFGPSTAKYGQWPLSD